MTAKPYALSARAKRTGDSPITYFIETAIETPGLISLAAGLVDEASLPAAKVQTATNAILSNDSTARAALQYGSTQGLLPLRETIVELLCQADGTNLETQNLSAADVVLTTGSQQMLYLLGEILFDVGDIVICEAPSYFVYHDCLKSHGATVFSVPMDQQGMNLDALEDLLTRLDQQGQLPRVKLIYTVDYYQNPTGLSLSEGRRQRLVEIAKKFSKEHRILILEDAAYRELRYEGNDLPSIKKYDPTNEYVIYTSTFSKPCAPGLKTGFSIVPKGLVDPICNLKGNHDFGSTNLAQHILQYMISHGLYAEHVKELQATYRKKKDAMVESVCREFADFPGASWTRPGGGLYVWLTLPPHVATGKGSPLLQRALAEKVLYIPGEFGHVPDEFGHVPKNEIRLSFGVASIEQIIEGVRRLRQACRGLETPTTSKAAVAK